MPVLYVAELAGASLVLVLPQSVGYGKPGKRVEGAHVESPLHLGWKPGRVLPGGIQAVLPNKDVECAGSAFRQDVES